MKKKTSSAGIAPPDLQPYRGAAYLMGHWQVKAAIRRRELEAINDRHQGFIDAGITLRRAELHKIAESLRKQLAPYIAEAALDRRIQLDELEQ